MIRVVIANDRNRSDGNVELCSDLIKTHLQHDCSVLMGANVANEVAAKDFCEATIGYRNKQNALLLQKLFDAPTFSIQIANDVPGVELCGALKNIVALGAGFVDGIGMGGNTKAAVMRIGIKEMSKFIRYFYRESSEDTMFESCGVAGNDIISLVFHLLPKDLDGRLIIFRSSMRPSHRAPSVVAAQISSRPASGAETASVPKHTQRPGNRGMR